MHELETWSGRGLITFDGHVIEKWESRPEQDSTRWHVRFVEEIFFGQPDSAGRIPISLRMEHAGKLVLTSFTEARRGAAEQLVAAVQQEIARRRQG